MFKERRLSGIKFTCTLDKLTLKIDRPRLSPADIEKLKEAARNNRAAE
jgi:hypothetical protein